MGDPIKVYITITTSPPYFPEMRRDIEKVLKEKGISRILEDGQTIPDSSNPDRTTSSFTKVSLPNLEDAMEFLQNPTLRPYQRRVEGIANVSMFPIKN